MTTQALDIFSLRDTVVEEYQRFATSFTTIHAEDIRAQVEAIYAQQRYWPEPLLQINPNYKRTTDIDSLVASGDLDPLCGQVFRYKGQPLRLMKHQEQSIALARDRESFVVTTGTGSGKSLCFFIPIVDAVLRARRAGEPRRTRAIVIYPMNALANSQREELRKFISQVSGDAPIKFDRYTGQEDSDERHRIADDPPDILLTNFMMLELLMTRQEEVDRRVIGNCAGLQFLVLDELHTYRGRQGADVAMLVRRVRERLCVEPPICIGTSATMASEGDELSRSQAVSSVASKLFACSIPESNIIGETLERLTDPHKDRDSVRPELGSAIDAGVPGTISDAALKQHPLAIWVETTLGMTFSESDQHYVRARPRTISEAVAQLAQDADRNEDDCRTALQSLLLTSSLTEQDRTSKPDAGESSFFAFKLHQFISGAGHAFATLEPPGQRAVTVDKQQFLPEHHEKRLYPVHFCRLCGHEYHPVRLVREDGKHRFLARDIEDAPPVLEKEEEAIQDEAEKEIFGFLTLHASDPDFTFQDREEDYPEQWVEYDKAGRPRLNAYYRKWRVSRFAVEADGWVGPGSQAWFLPGKFRFCLRCGTPQGGAARDRTRLASLSAEGRSSATTVLTASALRWMHGAESSMEPFTRKLLGFSDNRQDAALQAGHFNDFLFVSLTRAAFLGALQAAGATGLGSDELGLALQKALGFDQPGPDIRAEWLLEPKLRGFNLQQAERTLREVLAYRAWFDQRRGWRYTNPNLEQLDLIHVEYQGVDALAADDELFAEAHPILLAASHEVRAAVYRSLLDYMRQMLAIRSQVLESTWIEQMAARSHSQLRQPWGLGADERPQGARWLMITAPRRRESTLRDMDLIVRGSSRSGLGKKLKASDLWGGDRSIRDLKSAEIDKLVEDLLNAAKEHGLISEENTPFDATGWRLNDACIRFFLKSPSEGSARGTENAFFIDLYANLAAMLRTPLHPLFGFEAREHTAQVSSDKRGIREERFRYGKEERKALQERAKELREVGESPRFLPIIFCSPTMELGVDISALNVVHMRNMPPTPANYAQRSGRAGRSGQAALVISYASSQSPHDQYFFRDPRAMVHGEVHAPLLDLANRDLIDSHLQAVWLACVDQPLDPSIANLLVLSDPDRPLEHAVVEPMRQARVSTRATERIRRVIDSVAEELVPLQAPWFTDRDSYADAVVASVLERFDDAFDRWRDLFSAAEAQRDAARRTMDDYSAPHQEKRAAQSRHAQAIDQLNLLQRGSSALSSDFYTYRYLATEGFLPGYNFPRLPLMAYIPSTTDGRGRQTYLQRPRFLALSEFGPRSLVYHEGRAYRVVRALLALSHSDVATPDRRLPTRTIRICTQCGGGHFDDEASMCHACGKVLGEAEIVANLYKIDNVATMPADRITANDEERQRQGFELQTTFRWAIRDHEPDVRRATVMDPDGEIVSLAYGAGVTITRLNKGLRRRANKRVLGFRIDPVSGYWAKNDDEDNSPTDPTAAAPQWIVPMVQDRKNALLMVPTDDELGEGTLATVQHALLRGIEAVFQLEEGEILAESMPARSVRKGFLFYEATEGGAGVLVRLVSEPHALARVAREALVIMHFVLPEDGSLPTEPSALVEDADAACVAGCYRCLLSYYNQPDHEIIERRDDDARATLLRLAASSTRPRGASRRPSRPPPSEDGSVLDTWTEEASQRGLPASDPEPVDGGDPTSLRTWRRHYVAAVFDGCDAERVVALEEQGIEVIRFSGPPAWDDEFTRLSVALGRSA